MERPELIPLYHIAVLVPDGDRALALALDLALDLALALALDPGLDAVAIPLPLPLPLPHPPRLPVPVPDLLVQTAVHVVLRVLVGGLSSSHQCVLSYR